MYRLFLASEYAPALALANELIAQGDDVPILITIACECRTSITSLSSQGSSASSVPPSSEEAGSDPPPALQSRIFAGVDGKMTLEQFAAMTGMSLDQVLRLLERFVAMGLLTLRPGTR